MWLRRSYFAKFKYILVLLFCYSGLAFSWNSAGHRIVAAIAYQHLTPQARHEVNYLTRNMFYSRSAEARFLEAAVWPDKIKQQDVTAFNSWHFIDIPYRVGGVKGKPIVKQNVVWAIQQSFKVVSSPKSNRYEKSMFLAFLAHFVGDIHQPLHCAEMYSKQYPNGDKGGNLIPIQYPGATELHAFWDGGAGQFLSGPYFRNSSVYDLARKIQKRYPMQYFGATKIDSLDPWSWAQHSHALAVKYAYAGIKANSKLSQSYVRMAQTVCDQQLALAGYRLAHLLNLAFAHHGGKYS